MNKIRFINMCIVEFARKHKLPIALAFNYLKEYKAIAFIDRHYEAQHLLPLADTIKDLQMYCKRNGGCI